MSKHHKVLLVGAAFALSAGTPALAQEAVTTDVGTTLPVEDDDGDEGKWGLLGLLGLAGLLGLKRRDRDDHRHTNTTSTNNRL